MRVAVLQSNYLPWRGYFDIIQQSELFVFYDDVKFTKNDWRNRNILKSPNGPIWLTVPCPKKYDVLISEVVPTNAQWQEKHWRTILQLYGKAPFFSRFAPFFEDFYLGQTWDSLSVLNQQLIKHIAIECFHLDTEFQSSSDRVLEGVKSERLLDLLQQVGASEYVSGPAARSYIDEDDFRTRGINIHWMDYGGYREYRQLHPPFMSNVSILDLLFNVGADRDYLTSA